MRISTALLAAICILLTGCPGLKSAEPLPTNRSKAEETIVYSLEDTTLRVHPPVAPSAVSRDPSEENIATIELSNFLGHRPHDAEINVLVVSKDGRTAYSAANDGALVASTFIGSLEPTSGRKRYFQTEPMLRLSRPVLAIGLSPDERKLAVASTSLVLVFDLVERKVTNRLTRVKGRITSLAWDPRSELLAFGRTDGDVFVWRLQGGSDAGLNSLDAIEEYPGGLSPIIGLAFHPSGRAFFAAQREGKISLWRLLRTEEEMGLRDLNAVIDQQQKGRRQQQFANLGVQIEDVWIDAQGTFFYAATANGQVLRWKVRGLIQQAGISAGLDPVFSISGLSLKSDLLPIPVLVTSGRSQRVRFWCRGNAPVGNSAIAPPLPPPGESAPPPSPNTERLLAQTEIFREPVSIVRSSLDSPLLWAAQKTGNLLTFNAQTLLRSRGLKVRAEDCSSG